jgi:hypothetical protein
MGRMIKKHILTVTGLFLGTLAGYLYYHYTGCTNGSCIITSNQTITILYGALMGVLFLNLFKKQEKKSSD